MTAAERLVTLAATVVGCAAAVVMVPEVRCWAGLDSALECGDADLGSMLTPPLAATLRPAPREDPRIDPIRRRYRWIESGPAELRRFEPVPLGWGGADSASIIVYTDPWGVAKITTRVYEGNRRTLLLFYYSGGSMVFVHQLRQSGYPWLTESEQRLYFEGGRMFRWLAHDGSVVPESAPEFVQGSRELMGIGMELLDFARKLPMSGG